ncbi:MAG: Fe-S cluster assembly protein NifU [bacterium]
MWEYTEKVMDHFRNPRNVGVIDDADGVGEVGSMACGDALTLYIKVDQQGRIKDAKFQTFGCASAIASSSALTELIKGKTIEEALKITNQDIADYLGGLPEQKMHCSVMGREALLAAIANYKGQSRESLASPLVCECFGVTQEEIERAIRENGLTTREQVTHYTKAGGGCGSCHERIEEILARLKKEVPVVALPAQRRLTNLQKMRLVEETIERQIRPELQKDGGDIELVDVEGNRVMVSLRGVCTGCPSSNITIKGIEQKLKEMVSQDLVVEEVRQ